MIFFIKETLELFKREAKLTENEQGPEVKVENGCCENSNSLVSYTRSVLASL